MSGSRLFQLAGRGRAGRAPGGSGRTVVLVEPYWTRNKDPRVPLGHASLLAALRHHGVSVHSMPVPVNVAHLDLSILAEEVMERCGRARSEEIDVAIGVYVWGETLVRGLITLLRACGYRGRIILGGPQISYAGPGLEALYPEADVFVRGYGEDALAQLARAPGRPSIAGVHHAGDDDSAERVAVDLETLPSPWLNEIVPLKRGAFIRWETQRGCPYRCSFCQHREPGARLRRRLLDRRRVLAEVDLFCRAGVGEIAVLDPIFNLGDAPIQVLEGFAAGGFGGRLSLQCRAELIDERFLAAVDGLDVCLELGLQSIHAGECEAIERRNDVGRIDHALSAIRARGIAHEVSLIFGLPGQTLASFIESVRWCLEREVPTIKAFPLLLLRGTKLEREREAWGFEDGGGHMAMVRVSRSFTRDDWRDMARIAEALRLTEGRHPSIGNLLALAPDVTPDLANWQAPNNGGDAP